MEWFIGFFVTRSYVNIYQVLLVSHKLKKILMIGADSIKLVNLLDSLFREASLVFFSGRWH